MQYKIEFRRLATYEILDAFDWYELQMEGLGFEFLDDLELFQKKLDLNPTSFGYYDKPIRQGQLERFPYTIIYEIFDSTIIIYSVFMYKQDPVKKRKS